jgi:putative signal transducing protein
VTSGRLVRVATTRNPTEAKLVQSALDDAGIPSMDRATRAFDILDFLAVGPRDILVPEEAAEHAREVLGQAPDAPPPIGGTPRAFAERPGALFAKLFLGLIAAAAITWAIWQATG